MKLPYLSFLRRIIRLLVLTNEGDVQLTTYKYNGVTPSRVDLRDYNIRRFCAVEEAYPEEFTCTPSVPIHNQKSTSTCVAQSLAAVFEVYMSRIRNVFEDFSVGFIYGNRSGSDYMGEGMMPREALDHALKDGICVYALYPLVADFASCYNGITADMRLDARQYHITGYARITTAQELQAALYNTGPCTFSIPVYMSFEKTGSNGIVQPYGSNEALLGYHQVACIGWKTINGKLYFIIQNSWGANWGDKGLCYFPFDYMTFDPNAAEDKRIECWAVNGVAYEPWLSTAPFPDVPTSAWYAQDVSKAKMLGIVKGADDGLFHPAVNMTRAEAVTMLMRTLDYVNAHYQLKQ